MISFLVMAALMLGVAGFFLAPPLWRQASPAGAAPTPPQRGLAVGLLTLVALATATGYMAVGNPQAWSSLPPAERPSLPPMANGQAIGPAQIEGMVAGLAQRLQANPQDPEGWRMLARSYETLRRFPEAVGAYQQLIALRAPDADLLTDYAVALGMSLNQTLVGEPEAVLYRALELDPRHVQALALSGSAAMERNDPAHAVEQWQKLLALVPPGAEMRSSIEANIAKAQALAAQPNQARAAAITGR